MNLQSHYFIDDPALPHEYKRFNFYFKSREYTFVTDTGVFSPGEVDGNTAYMLRHIPQLGGSLLDMGCGYGCVGILLGGEYGLQVTAVDINPRAVRLAEENAKLNDVPVRVLVSDCYSEVDGTFDAIVINPPVHAGKDVMYRMYEGAPAHLNPGGCLYTVLYKKHGAESARKKLTEVFGHCETVATDKSRYVYRCKKQ
jgi:16S rRNA (guanine1207-N2)-methyltransferase